MALNRILNDKSLTEDDSKIVFRQAFLIVY